MNEKVLRLVEITIITHFDDRTGNVHEQKEELLAQEFQYKL